MTFANNHKVTIVSCEAFEDIGIIGIYNKEHVKMFCGLKMYLCKINAGDASIPKATFEKHALRFAERFEEEEVCIQQGLRILPVVDTILGELLSSSKQQGKRPNTRSAAALDADLHLTWQQLLEAACWIRLNRRHFFYYERQRQWKAFCLKKPGSRKCRSAGGRMSSEDGKAGVEKVVDCLLSNEDRSSKRHIHCSFPQKLCAATKSSRSNRRGGR